MSSLYTLGTQVTLFFTFTVDDVPTDPTTVTFTIELPDGTTETANFGDPGVTNPSTGVYEYAYDPPMVGTYQYKIAGTGSATATSSTGTFAVTGDAITTDYSIVGGPCEPWITSYDVAECCGIAVAGADFPRLDQSAYAATELLYLLSGSQYSGQCEATVRPCGESLCAGPWRRWNESQRWGCGCSSLDRVPLAGGVNEIVEVLLDGEVVDPATYEVSEGMWLDRINDPTDPDTNLYWPSCENRRLALTEEGTFGITYRYGKPPPYAGQLAAKELACAVYQTCTSSEQAVLDGECSLPNGVTRIDRQGITIELAAFRSWGLTDSKWVTGMPLVDAFLNAVNPKNVRKLKAQVWSPDLWKYPRPVGRGASSAT